MSSMYSRLALLSFLVGCGDSGYVVTPQKRVLDSFPYVDCGAIVPGDRQVCTVPLFSQAAGKVQIFDIAATDIKIPENGVQADAEGAFIVRDTDWMSPDCGDGDCVQLEGYDDESDEDTLALPLTFAPNVEGYYQAELTIWSNDTESQETEPLPDEPDRSEPVWKVQLRGLARPACGRVLPDFMDLGLKPAGGGFSGTATIENCGIVTLVVAAFDDAGSGAGAMSVTNTPPLYVLPGLSEEINVSWQVGATTDIDGDGDLDPTPVEDTFSFVSNADNLDLQTLSVIGNTCEGSVLSDWDADADGWSVCGGDCNDGDPTANPSATERAGNGHDDDCDGTVDETANPVGSDDDGDGFSENAGDCDDTDASVFPGAVEVEDQVDGDCNDTIDDATEWYDDDRDGFSEREGDCDDDNVLVYPGAEETTDSIDNDCDDMVDEGGPTVDDDQDGFAEITAGVEDDCDDGDPWVYIGAFEFCDGYDNDCDGVADEGEDDVADGACAFLPAREPAVIVQPKKCETASAPSAFGFALAALGLAAGRRRRVTGR